MKLFCVFHRRMVALGYHVHCDQNKMTQRLLIILDSRYRVTSYNCRVASLMFPIANRYWHRAFHGPWSVRAKLDHFEYQANWLWSMDEWLCPKVFCNGDVWILINANLGAGFNHHSLRWRHNDHAGVSNHQPHGCLLNRLFRRRSK